MEKWEDLLRHALRDTEEFVRTFPCGYCKEDFVPVMEQFRFYLEAGQMMSEPEVDKAKYVEARLRHPSSLLVRDTADLARQLRDHAASEAGAPSPPVFDPRPRTNGPLGFGIVPAGRRMADGILADMRRIRDVQGAARGILGR